MIDSRTHLALVSMLSLHSKDIFTKEPTKEENKRPGFPTHARKDKSPGRFLARAKRK